MGATTGYPGAGFDRGVAGDCRTPLGIQPHPRKWGYYKQIKEHMEMYKERFTSEIHEPTIEIKEQRPHGREKIRKRLSPFLTLGYLGKSWNEPISDFHRVTFPLFTKLDPHLFVLCYGPRASNSHHVDPPRDPCALCNDHRSGSV